MPAHKITIQVGQRFGKLVTVSPQGRDKHKNHLWLCQCDCGNTIIATQSHLKNGFVQYCGCSKKSRLTREDISLSGILASMKYRCSNLKDENYCYYGARGITVCEEWQHVDKFREWAYNNGYKLGLTIDRIDVNGNYEPSNCRWVTIQEQQHNKRSNHYITYKGETKCLAEWAHILGINYGTLSSRLLDSKWDIEKAFTTPVRKRKS